MTWISSVTFSYTLFQEEKGSLVSTRPLALEVIHWQGKCIAVGVMSAARDTGKNTSSYLGWWWSSHLLSGGVVMSIPGTPICSTFPYPTNWGRKWGRKNQSSLNTYCQQRWSADLPNYFISIVLFNAAMDTLGNTTGWNFSHFKGLEDNKISSLFCSVIVIS